MFALFLLMLMALLIAATLPISVRSNVAAADMTAAQALIGRKVAQLQQAGYGSLNGPTLGQAGLGIVDGLPATPTATENAEGMRHATFEFTQTERLEQVLGVDVASGTSVPQGQIFLSPYEPAVVVVDGKPVSPVVRACVLVRWNDSRGQKHFASGVALIPRARLDR